MRMILEGVPVLEPVLIGFEMAVRGVGRIGVYSAGCFGRGLIGWLCLNERLLVCRYSACLKHETPWWIVKCD